MPRRRRRASAARCRASWRPGSRGRCGRTRPRAGWPGGRARRGRRGRGGLRLPVRERHRRPGRLTGSARISRRPLDGRLGRRYRSDRRHQLLARRSRPGRLSRRGGCRRGSCRRSRRRRGGRCWCRGSGAAVGRELAITGARTCSLCCGALLLSLPGLSREGFLEPANDRRLDCRGCRAHKLAHLLELGHHGLALHAELFRELVYPDLRHCAPSTRSGGAGPVSRPGQRVLRPASACAVHRRMLIGRSSQSQPAFPGMCRSRVVSGRFALASRTGTRNLEIPGEPAGAKRSRQAQCPRENPTTPRLIKASLTWMQVRTPARHPR